MSEQEPLQVLLSRVSAAVGAVKKESKAGEGGGPKYNFRGIDAVVNALHPHLTAHGVVVRPTAVHVDYSDVETGNKRTPMARVTVVVTYTFTGPAGDSLDVVAPGEAFDSGDKATAKAMSVAFRTALLQTFTLPTDEADPDAAHYERSAPDALTEQQEATVAEFAQAIRSTDQDDHLRGLWQDVARSTLPEHAIVGLQALINERKRTLDAQKESTA